jgi:hypothetical protein
VFDETQSKVEGESSFTKAVHPEAKAEGFFMDAKK